jgi:hypothetical protein
MKFLLILSRPSCTAALMLAVFSSQPGCNAAVEKYGGSSIKEKIPDGSIMNLTLHGYNYTNRYIDEYSVDGSGGGNLFVSDPGSSGGGSVCCATLIKGGEQIVKVRWQADACIYRAKSATSSETYDRILSIYKEVDVLVNPNVPDNPHYFEVHFYADGHVEAAITENGSRSRLPLTKDREDRTEFPRCSNAQEPKI